MSKCRKMSLTSPLSNQSLKTSTVQMVPDPLLSVYVNPVGIQEHATAL